MKTAIPRAELARLFDATAADHARAWLADAAAQVAERPDHLGVLFPAAARACGREPLSEAWRTDVAARVLLITARPWRGPEPASTVYRQGNADERLAVLLALDVADGADQALLPLTLDAVRSNDTRLIAAALGSFAARHLSAAEFRQAVLKCVFCGVPLTEIAGLPETGGDGLAAAAEAESETGVGTAERSVGGVPDRSDADEPETGAGTAERSAVGVPDRTDAELARMLADFARERVAAGRAVPDDVWPILRLFPAAVADSGLLAEPSAADPVRASAARQALDSYHRLGSR